MPNKDPFAGFALSKPVEGGKIDQQLFTSRPTPSSQPAPVATKPSPPVQPAPTKPPAETAPETRVRLSSLARTLDLAERPLYQGNFVFTQAELEALEDLKLELRREHDFRVSKNDIIRAALHMLSEDYTATGERSYIFRKLRKR